MTRLALFLLLGKEAFLLYSMVLQCRLQTENEVKNSLAMNDYRINKIAKKINSSRTTYSELIVCSLATNKVGQLCVSIFDVVKSCTPII